MSYTVAFDVVASTGLEEAEAVIRPALAGLRANEARYFSTHYGQDFVVFSRAEKPQIAEYIETVLRGERDIVLASPLLEVAELNVTVENVGPVRWTHGIYASGLMLNVLYSLDSEKKRAVGFKLSEGMDQPAELAGFKFARQKSRLAGTIRGSYFVIKNQY